MDSTRCLFTFPSSDYDSDLTIQAWLPSFIAAITFLVTTAAILFLALANLPLSSKFRRAPKFDESEDGIRERVPSDVAPLMNPYRPTREWFYLPLLASVFVRAAFIAFAKVSRHLSSCRGSY